MEVLLHIGAYGVPSLTVQSEKLVVFQRDTSAALWLDTNRTRYCMVKLSMIVQELQLTLSDSGLTVAIGAMYR